MHGGPARIIKSVKFEDGSFTIRPASDPTVPETPAGPVAAGHDAGMSVAARAQADALLREAETQAETIVAMARAEAEAVKEQALRDIEAMKMNAIEKGTREGLERGYAEGHAHATQEVHAATAQLLDALAAGVEADARARAAWLAEQERDVVKMAIMIAQKILLLELATNRDSVLALARAAIARVTDKTHVRVRVAAEDLEAVSAAREALRLSVDNLSSLEVVADPRVGAGGCLVESRTGIVDARVATQLAEVASALLEVPLGAPQDMDATVAKLVSALGEGDALSLLKPPSLNERLEAIAPPAAPAAPVAPVVPPRPVAPPQAVAPAVPQAVAPTPIAIEADEAPAPVADFVPDPEPDVPAWEAPLPEPAVTEAPPAPEPAPAPVASEPEAPAAPVTRRLDPSRRAAEALALRLGKRERGKAVHTLQEEHDMSAFEGALSDTELEAIVQQVMPKAAGLELLPGETLVPGGAPTSSVEEAAEALAARLGQKTHKKWDPAAIDAIAEALDDATIDRILQSIPHVAPTESREAAPAPGLDVAAEKLAERMGKKLRKPVFPVLEGEARPAGVPVEGVLADDSIDAILDKVVPKAPAESAEAAEAAPPPTLDLAAEKLAERMGKKKTGHRPWYADLEGQ